VKELLQRLGALDESAEAALKIITYFDTLLEQGAGIEPFLRGAAVLSGFPAGFAHPVHRIWVRVDGEGRPLPGAEDPQAATSWPHKELGDGSGGVVWLERPGAPGVNDALLLERVASGLHITLERVSPLDLDDAGAIEVLLSTTSTDDARRKAARRLRLREKSLVRVLASPPDAEHLAGARSAVLGTRVGPVMASVVEAAAELPPRAGVGDAGEIRELDRSWAQAQIALRLSSRVVPQVRWEDLGALGALAQAADANPAVDHEDLDAVAQVCAEEWGEDTLDAILVTDSVRAAAQELGLHHSTVQARQTQVERTLGFKVGSGLGRARLAAALVLHRVRTVRFEA
jgi:hypothetical protein